jgi:hypothetical protein
MRQSNGRRIALRESRQGIAPGADGVESVSMGKKDLPKKRGTGSGKRTKDEKGGGGSRPTVRDTQGPIGQPASKDGTWVSGDQQGDPLREEAAERASRAVEPGRPRE